MRGVVLGGLLLVAGCGGGGGSTASVRKTTIQAVAFSPDAPSVNVLVDDRTVAAGLGSASLGNVTDLDQSQGDLRGVDPATGVDFSADTVEFTASKDYLAYAVGLANFGDEYSKRLRLGFAEIDRTVPNGSKARLIFLHAFVRQAGAETPDVDFQDGDRPQFAATGIGFGEIGTITADVGTYTFQARRAGTQLVYAERALTLESGRIYLVVFGGREGGAGAQAPSVEAYPLAVR